MKNWPWRQIISHQQKENRNNKISYKLLTQNEQSVADFGANGLSNESSSPEMNIKTYELNHQFVELVGSKKSSGCGKALCCTFLLIVLLALFGGGFYYYNYRNTDTATSASLVNGASAIQLNDFLENSLYAKRNNATWISDNELMYKDASGNIVKFNVNTNKTSVIASIQTPVIPLSFTQELSPDHRYLLLGKDFQKIFRHSAAARYEIIDLQTLKVYNLTEHYLLLAEWGPVGNSLVFVKDNDIYYKYNVTEPEIRISEDGQENIYNGVCDWVYEEEVFSGKKAVWFSPDASKLAYIRFDDTPVRRMQIPIYGIPGALEFQYPAELVFSYPKTGSPNPLVRLFTVDLSKVLEKEELPRYEVMVPEPLEIFPHIISVVAWTNNNTLLSTWMNRVQNQAYVQTCVNDKCRLVFNITSSTGWVDFFKAPLFNADGSQFLYITPQKQEAVNDSYPHLTMVDLETGTQKPITKGNFVVTEILSWDKSNNYVFYAANAENASQVLHIYATNVDVNQAGRKQFCLTCKIVRNGANQTYFSAIFSPDSKHLLLSSDGPSIPRTDLATYEIKNDGAALKYNVAWEENAALQKMLQNRTKPIVVYERIPLKDGFEAAVKLQLPPNVDLSGRRKYPMLIDVYAGPGSYAGTDEWRYGYSTYLTTSRSYIYAQINGRGSGNRGQKLLHSLYKRMGTVEIEDQITTAKKLAEKLPYIDPKNIGIWGWSYGGYASAMALAKDNASVLKCAASVAPVTDWTYYDTIYTERYMGLPIQADNLAGYDRSRLSTLHEQFQNKTFLLVHGSLDDNVHYQQSLALARSLELNDVPFQQITYPDEDHALWGVRKHLYHALDKFFRVCFEGLTAA